MHKHAVCHSVNALLWFRQSILTGESGSVEKYLDAITNRRAVYQDKTCLLFSVNPLPCDMTSLSLHVDEHTAVLCGHGSIAQARVPVLDVVTRLDSALLIDFGPAAIRSQTN